jgi:putative spermidine/putrescine transport system substrate-binding protein
MHRTKKLARIAAIGVLAVATAACGSDGGGTSASGSESSASGPITYVGYGGETQEGQITAWQEPFTKESGIEFQNDTPPTLVQVKAMVESGNVTWDVMGAAAAETKQYCGELFEPLTDVDVHPGVYDYLPKEEIGDCGLPVFTAPSIPFYNTDMFKDDPPTTLADMFDTQKYPGKRSFLPFITAGTLETALLADGVDPDELYPLDVERALKKLDTLGDDLVIPANYGELQQGMANGNVAFALSTPSRASFTIDDGAPYAPIWDITVASVSVVGIPKGAPNVEAAKEWLAFVSQPEPQAKAAELTTLPPANAESEPEYDEVQQLVDAHSDENSDTIVWMDSAWWAENQPATQARFTQWQVG